MKIKFHPVNATASSLVTPPRPAREYVPEWYKNIPAFHDGKPTFDVNNKIKTSLKMCMPFADSLKAGYIQEMWQDVYIEADKNGVKLTNSTNPAPVTIREHGPSLAPMGFYPAEFVFHPMYGIEVPKGWSVLITSPLNRMDLPFEFTSGIIDADQLTHSIENASLPFYVKTGFSGFIPKGTPLYQIIPIKRESWESEVTEYDFKAQAKIFAPIVNKFWGGYKQNYWQKKTYK